MRERSDAISWRSGRILQTYAIALMSTALSIGVVGVLVVVQGDRIGATGAAHAPMGESSMAVGIARHGPARSSDARVQPDPSGTPAEIPARGPGRGGGPFVPRTMLGVDAPEAPAAVSDSPTWTQAFPATGPSARFNASSTYDPATRRVLLFGGQTGAGALGDTWAWDGAMWIRHRPPAGPPARGAGAMAYDAATGQLVLFGGQGSGGGVLADTWTWNGATWTKLTPATSPTARKGASLAFDQATGQLVLFGGGNGSVALRDTWTWNGATWTKVAPAASPPARKGASLAFDQATGQLLLFGGINGTTVFGDTWAWRGSTWVKRSPKASPPARYLAATAYDQATGQLLVFGGKDGTNNVLGDSWRWSGDTWAPLSPTTSPSARFNATMDYDPTTGTVLLFGGSRDAALGDTWVYGATVPDAPTIGNATAGDAQATVSFTPPALTGGLPVTGYTATATDLTTPAHGGETSSGASSPITVGGLANGDSYTFAVSATNGAGTGPASAASNVVVPSVSGNHPIKHVIVILEENHSFDNTLGKFCAEVSDGQLTRPGVNARCDGATQGVTDTGQIVDLAPASDIVPPSDHTVVGQRRDIDGGKMDGFSLDPACALDLGTCYSQYDPLAGPCANGSCIPNYAALASMYAVSDRTFESRTSPSWAGHLVWATANQDGFFGANPSTSGTGPKPVSVQSGWGCDSGRVTPWGAARVLVPSCVPDAHGDLGPNWAGYSGATAPYLPTIFDELDAKGLSWKIYGGAGAPPPNSTAGFEPGGWQWAICPTFVECLYTPQRSNVTSSARLIADAASGQLPAFSIVTPTTADSQHNSDAMSTGDNFIGRTVSAVRASADWSSTAIFITYDDCGCFYDHVNPLQFGSSWGIRVPMVIVSPFAKLGYTDSGSTTFDGTLAFAEHQFGLPALNATDATAYDYSNSFCFDPRTAGCVAAGSSAPALREQTPTTMSRAQQAAQARAGREDT
jgi:phospholipase C